MIPPSPSRSQRDLGLIRISLLIGVITFGAVTWWLQRSGSRPAAEVSTTSTLRIAGFALWASAIGLLAFLRSRLAKVSDSTRRSYLIISWAVSEAVALYGGAVYFLTGDARWFIAGLFFMISAFVVFPLRRG